MDNKLFDQMLQLEESHWWFVARRKIIESLIRKKNSQDKLQILETGCGNGANLEFLSHFGDVTAIEKNKSALENAEKKQVAKIYKGELPDGLPVSIQERFDLIVMLDVLEHIDDDDACLRVLHNYINDSGLLLITVPAYENLWSQHDEIHQHKRRYSMTQLGVLLKNNNWQIRYISHFNTLLFPLAWINRKYNAIKSRDHHELDIPPKWINFLLKSIFSIEKYLIGSISLPFGLSIIVLAEKK